MIAFRDFAKRMGSRPWAVILPKKQVVSMSLSSSLISRSALRCQSSLLLFPTSSWDQNDHTAVKESIGKKEVPIAAPANVTNSLADLVQYYVPKANRTSEDCAFEVCMNRMGDKRLKRNSRICPTRELNYTPEHWQLHKSPYRKFRHMLNLPTSSPIQRLMFPDIFTVTAISGAVTYYNEFIACSNTVATMSASAFAGATTAIGLLAGFKLNASYGRYEEARIFWADTNSCIRDLARQVKQWIRHDEETQTRMLRLCQAYPLTLMFHLNDKGCYHNMPKKSKPGQAPFADRIQAEFQAELADIYNQPGSSKEDYERLCQVKYSGGNAPLEVLICMGEVLASCVGKLEPQYARGLDDQVQKLGFALGASERIMRTPLPTGFTRHSSRLLFIWSNCLPFAMYPILGPYGTLPTVLLTSYAVLGIEDQSVQLEEPFDILPLRQYSDGMFDGVRAIEQGFRPYKGGVSVNSK
jgi:ion channel-forming bestrophin family protein